MEIEFPPLSKLINKSFVSLWKKEKDFDVIILMGGRDSSKTNWTAKKLILKCLSDNYFRCILIRKNLNAVPDSQWLTIKEEIESIQLQIDQAKRSFDLNKAAELEFGTLNSLQKKLHEYKQLNY